MWISPFFILIDVGMVHYNLGSRGKKRPFQVVLPAHSVKVAYSYTLKRHRKDGKKNCKGGTGKAVVCFRGTKQIKDWMTNLEISAVPIKDTMAGALIDERQKGFHDAYRPVHNDISNRLKGNDD